MGHITAIQGAALTREFRVLVLTRGLTAPLSCHLAPAGQVSFAPATTSPALQQELASRQVTAYLCVASGLLPDTRYRLELSSGPAAATLETKTLPQALPSQGLTVSVGTCFYEGFNMGSQLGAALSQMQLLEPPRLQIWGGDNVYLDVPNFGVQGTTYGHTAERYLKYFDDTAYVKARSLAPNYSTYDDHEFWNNFPQRPLWLSRSWGSERNAYISAARDCVDLFQASLNPSRVASGRSFSFSIAPLSFFFADVRSQRSENDAASPRMMTAEDLTALVDWTQGLTGPGVLVLGQPWWIETGNFKDYNPPAFVAQYRAVWNALRDAPYDILIVSGDVHHSRVLALDLQQTPGSKVYEFTTSPASHIPSLWASVGFGHSQSRGKVEPPGRIENAPFPVGARYYFGTSVPNCFGLLHFAQKAGGELGVGAAFVDYARKPAVFPRNEPCRSLPSSGLTLPDCFSTQLFTLRRRS